MFFLFLHENMGTRYKRLKISMGAYDDLNWTPLSAYTQKITNNKMTYIETWFEDTMIIFVVLSYYTSILSNYTGTQNFPVKIEPGLR